MNTHHRHSAHAVSEPCERELHVTTHNAAYLGALGARGGCGARVLLAIRLWLGSSRVQAVQHLLDGGHHVDYGCNANRSDCNLSLPDSKLRNDQRWWRVQPSVGVDV